MKTTAEKPLYKSKFLNRFANTNPFVVVGLFTLISSMIFILGCFKLDSNVLLAIALPLGGMFTFTFIEYTFHRFLYHSGEDYKSDENWQYLIHGVHHVHPNETHILAMPIPLAMVVGGSFFSLFYLIMGNLAILFFPGFLFGYAVYIFIHAKIHTQAPPNNVFKYFWKYHHIHHYLYEDKAYGVSTRFWDYVFRTNPPKDLKSIREK